MQKSVGNVMLQTGKGMDSRVRGNDESYFAPKNLLYSDSPRTKPMKPSRETKWLLLGGAVPVLLLAGGLGWNWYKTVPPLEIRDATLPSPNAYDTFKKAALSLKMPPYPIEVDPALGFDESPQNPAEFRRRYPPARREFWLGLNQSSFADFNRALRQEYRVPPYRKYNRHDWPGTPLPPFYSLRRAVLTRIYAQCERGDWESAAQTSLDLMQFGITIPRGGGVTSHLIGHSVESVARRELWKILPHLNAKQAAHAAMRMENLMTRRVSLANSLREEKTNYLVHIRGMCRDQEAFAAMASGGPNDWKFTLAFRLISPRIILNNYSREMDKTIASTQKSYSEVLNERSDDSFPQTLSDPLTGRIYPSFKRTRLLDFQRRAESNLLCTALALRAFRLQNGRYPQTLNELVPRYLSRVPDDPYEMNRSLSYKLKPTRFVLRTVMVWADPKRIPPPNSVMTSGVLKEIACEAVLPYTLYSVGSDGRDNGGKPVELSPSNRRDGYWRYDPGDEYKGDFVVGPHTTRHIVDRSRIKNFAFAYSVDDTPPRTPTPAPLSEAAIRRAFIAAPPLSSITPDRGFGLDY